MAGAYVAKPEAVPDPPDVPDGWDFDWPFPGAFPPGYEPDYSIDLEAPASVSIGNSMSLTATLRDHDTYATTEPDSVCLQQWTATIDGETVQLKVGEGDYAESYDAVYVAVGEYWGATPEIMPQLLTEHDGKTLVISVSTTIDEEIVTETADIPVSTQVDVTFSCIVSEFSITDEDDHLYAELRLRTFSVTNVVPVLNDGTSEYGQYWETPAGTGLGYWEENPPDITYANNREAIGSSIKTPNEDVYITLTAGVGLVSHSLGKTASISAEVVINGVEYEQTLSSDSVEFSSIFAPGQVSGVVWLKIDGDTKEVTVINEPLSGYF